MSGVAITNTVRHTAGLPGFSRPSQRRSPTWLTCRRAASRSPTATFPTSRAQGRQSNARRPGDPARARRSARATAAYVSNAKALERMFAAFSNRLQKGRHHTGEHASSSSATRRTPVAGANVAGRGQPSRRDATEVRSMPLCQTVRSGDAGKRSRDCTRRPRATTQRFDVEPKGARIDYTVNRPRTRPALRSSNAHRVDDRGQHV